MLVFILGQISLSASQRGGKWLTNGISCHDNLSAIVTELVGLLEWIQETTRTGQCIAGTVCLAIDGFCRHDFVQLLTLSWLAGIPGEKAVRGI